MHRFLPAIALTASILAGHAAHAITFQTALVGSQQNPPVTTQATGSATVVLEDDNKTLDVSVNFSGLSGSGTFGHIHCCATIGRNAGVVIEFAGLPTTTSGSFTNSYDLSTFALGNSQTEASFISGLEAGLAYVNIHDSIFPNGEIRGQLSAVPEPSVTWLFAGVALMTMTVARRRLG